MSKEVIRKILVTIGAIQDRQAQKTRKESVLVAHQESEEEDVKIAHLVRGRRLPPLHLENESEEGQRV
jgi:hypothetical protein